MRLIVFAALALLAVGCSSGLNRPVREVTATTDAHGVQHLRLTAHSYYFDPNRLVVKVGQPVELRIRNAAWFTPHNFSCDAAAAGIRVDKDLSWFGGSRTVRFIPVKEGEYPFHCDVDKHAAHGMRGVLVVTP